MNRLSSDQFIENCYKIHNNRYDYSLVEYVKSNIKIKIICNEHGMFEQTPNNHIHHKKGCPKCNGGIKYNISEFVEKSNKIHNNRYDYSTVNYIDSVYKVDITCKNHGIFKQTPHAHLIGQNCPTCSKNERKINKEEFIKRSIGTHGYKYNYSEIEYINYSTKIDIECNCGFIFKQNPKNHLHGQGCPKCSSKNISKSEIKWLDSINIQEEHRHITLTVDSINFFVDAFDPIKNIIYEFYGDYWHGNPNIHNPDEFNSHNKIKFSDLYIKTTEREKIFIKNKYTVVSIWESDFKNNNKLCK